MKHTSQAIDDEKVLIAGAFYNYLGVIRNGIARISLNSATSKVKYRYNQQESQPTITTYNELLVYPSPVESYVTINNLIDGSTIQVFNSIGQEMYSTRITNEKITIGISGYSNGLYYVLEQNKGAIRSNSKFIVNKQ